ncbi:MAG: cytochrome ubiquinol oxidase subunit I [Candidatus Hodarchaeales archaeon]|jgi:cytochrome d ubiquinol oxidase subunit I
MVDTQPVLGLFSLFFSLHIILVNIDMGMAVLIPILKRLGETKEKTHYITHAKSHMRYLAIFYASAGVFGTGFSVLLLVFLPDFLWLVGQTLFIPFSLAVIFIAIRLLCISTYWYGWDKFTSKNHLFIGLILASTSFIVPFFFRTVFGFLSYPDAILSSVDPLVIQPLDFILNPIFIPLYGKSIFGAFTLTFFMLITVYSIRSIKQIGSNDTNLEFIKLFLKFGGVLYIIQLFWGTLYLLTLSIVPLKFNNILGLDTTDYSNLGLFITKLSFIFLQGIILIYLFNHFNINKLTLNESKLAKLSLVLLGPLALLTIVSGEMLNIFSQLPYIVLGPGIETIFPMINFDNAINELSAIFDIYFITIILLVPLLLGLLYLLYWIFKLNNQETKLS